MAYQLVYCFRLITLKDEVFLHLLSHLTEEPDHATTDASTHCSVQSQLLTVYSPVALLLLISSRQGFIFQCLIQLMHHTDLFQFFQSHLTEHHEGVASDLPLSPSTNGCACF
jgi:hypothetical protein